MSHARQRPVRASRLRRSAVRSTGARLSGARLGGARRGMALVVVLWSVALLATVTAIASSSSRGSATIATNLRAQATARAMAESGILAARSLIDDSLRVWRTDATRRDAFLDRLEPREPVARPLLQDSLADGVFAVTVVDVSARLDVNASDAEGLTRLLATATSSGVARDMALRIVAAVRGDDLADEDPRLRARDSLNAALLGREASPRQRRPFETLDALRDVPGLDPAVLRRVVPLLTVDGDGRINRRAAPREVLAAASGSLVDAPSRLLLIARGWHVGHALTRQIEAVYDVTDNGLRLVRWREHDR